MGQKEDKESALFTAEQLHYVEQRPVHNLLLNNNSAKLDKITNKVHKQLLNQTLPQQQRGNNRNGNEQRIRYLNTLFDKQRNAAQVSTITSNSLPAINPSLSFQAQPNMELPSTSAGSGSGNGTAEDDDYAAVTSSDDNEENALSRKHKNHYNYSETNFEEDDPMEQAQLRDIKVNIPEPMWKERKCPACSKRFMHEDTHQLHIENCVEYQFVNFVSEVTKLLDIKRQKMVSPHEFIRRMIFALHKTCNWLQEHSIDTQLADKLNQVKVSNGNNGAEKAAPEIEPVAEVMTKPKSPTSWESDAANLFKFSSRTTTPITVENNVLYAIERSESRNSQNMPNVVKKPIPIRCTALAADAAPVPLQHEERASFLQKLQRAAITPQQSPVQVAATPISAARCSQCNLLFDSVSDLELHNVMHHNGAAGGQCNNTKDDDAQRRRIIALFEDDI